MGSLFIIYFYIVILLELWSLVLCSFGVQWVMSNRVVDLLVYWKGHFTSHHNSDIWITIPLCIMCTIWKEHKSRRFKGLERDVTDLQLIFLPSLYDWMIALSCHSFSNLLDLLDCCNFSWFVVPLKYTTCVLGGGLYSLLIKFLTYQKSPRKQNEDKFQLNHSRWVNHMDLALCICLIANSIYY